MMIDAKLCTHLQPQATEDLCKIRSPEEHDEFCDEIEEDPSKSREHGINSNSVLNDLKYFHVSSGALVPDIMHDMLEGALQYEAKLIMQEFIYNDHYVSLADINSVIENFDFGHSEGKTRPTPISAQTLSNLDNSLKQNGTYITLYYLKKSPGYYRLLFSIHIL